MRKSKFYGTFVLEHPTHWLISTQALAKVDEATDPAQPLSKEDFVDDLALTSMARLWDVGKSEPIKVGKASPTEGTLPGAVYFIVKYDNLAAAARANAEVGGDSASTIYYRSVTGYRSTCSSRRRSSSCTSRARRRSSTSSSRPTSSRRRRAQPS